jgi:hypothetical protein
MKVNPGDRYGQLTIIKEVEKFVQPSGQTQRGFLCKCSCGSFSRIRLSHLTTGRVVTCGHRNHGGSGSSLHTKNYFQKHLYYEKGIRVCDEWKQYASFEKWAKANGYKRGLQIDRIDNSQGYNPDNCQFVTPLKNMANRDITFMVDYNGGQRAFTELMRELGKERHIAAIRARINRGWDHQKAIDTPIKNGNYKVKEYDQGN